MSDDNKSQHNSPFGDPVVPLWQLTHRAELAEEAGLPESEPVPRQFMAPTDFFAGREGPEGVNPVGGEDLAYDGEEARGLAGRFERWWNDPNGSKRLKTAGIAGSGMLLATFLILAITVAKENKAAAEAAKLAALATSRPAVTTPVAESSTYYTAEPMTARDWSEIYQNGDDPELF